MTYSSCLTDQGTELILDSSVVINLLATGSLIPIVRALAVPVNVSDKVLLEIELGAANGRPEFHLLMKMVNDQILGLRELDGQALAIFFDLVSGSATESLGDGEAATLALAHVHGCYAAIDEKKASRLAADCFDSMKLVTTVDILAHHNVRACLGDAVLADAALNALRFARMQVRENQFNWIASLIGQESIEICPSLTRHMRRKSALCPTVE